MNHKISRMSVQQVEKQYARKPDKSDRYGDMQVFHYEVSKTFRIHAINEEGQYRVIRIDPNHRFHG